MIYRWKQKANGVDQLTKGKNEMVIGDVVAENAQLKSQLRRTSIERDILKKGAAASLYSKSLKRLMKVVIVHTYKADGSIKSCKIFASTDTALTGIDLWYYHLHFQSEFLYRDAKQHLGLTHCQSRQQKRLNSHFNFSLTVLSLAKIVHWLSKPMQERNSFSIQDIKTHYFNQHMLDSFIQGFGLCPITAKNNPVYCKLANYAKLAAYMLSYYCVRKVGIN